MRAIVQDSYGSPELLGVKEVNGPRVGKSQVLVRVCAASLNAGDWRRVRGNPFMVRVVEGLRRPRWPLFGTDLAGVVEELGSGATSLEVGDEVFGTAQGLAGRVRQREGCRTQACRSLLRGGGLCAGGRANCAPGLAGQGARSGRGPMYWSMGPVGE